MAPHRSPLTRRSALAACLAGGLGAVLVGAPASSALAGPYGTLRRSAGDLPGTYRAASDGSEVTRTAAAAAVLRGPRSGLPWVSGAFTDHDTASLAAFEAGRGRKLDAASVFTSRESTRAGLNTWWLDPARPVTSDGGWLLLAVPLWNDDQTVSSDTSAFFTGLGTALARAGVAQRTVVRLGWEMNLPSWRHRVTPGNRTAWTAAFRAAAGRLRAAAPGIRVAFNPNEGGDQTGVPMTGLATDLLDSYDLVGPDFYNWYPVVNDQATWDRVYARQGGLRQWEDFARANGKGYTVPEWGGFPGADAGRGSDGSFYTAQMVRRFRELSGSGTTVVEAHFNEPASYIANSLWAPTQMPAMARAYRAALA
ncbi:hypothetical protein [Quadrisphaera sp. INWT6]|uniref:hypothetical protein n=1 Tax=Quadrisphaera sp. INWT6 TaxID=2596917 RepID=UPI001891F588|nr:hypothetical protein [Quadrisphaera sp. INWT6]MBF5080378.1 hypothetical protein [Quadrisphaera sp. INWT6]